VLCSFELQFQYTLDQSEVELDPGGDGKKDFCPTDAALKTLARDMAEALGQNWSVSSFEAYADSDDLLGVIERTR